MHTSSSGPQVEEHLNLNKEGVTRTGQIWDVSVKSIFESSFGIQTVLQRDMPRFWVLLSH